MMSKESKEKKILRADKSRGINNHINDSLNVFLHLFLLLHYTYRSKSRYRHLFVFCIMIIMENISQKRRWFKNPDDLLRYVCVCDRRHEMME